MFKVRNSFSLTKQFSPCETVSQVRNSFPHAKQFPTYEAVSHVRSSFSLTKQFSTCETVSQNLCYLGGQEITMLDINELERGVVYDVDIFFYIYFADLALKEKIYYHVGNIFVLPSFLTCVSDVGIGADLT